MPTSPLQGEVVSEEKVPKVPDRQELRQDRKRKFSAWVEEKIGTSMRPCSLCGQTKWFLGNDVVTARIFKEPGISLTGETYAFSMVICGNCGNTHFLNAVMMGLLPPIPPEKKDQ